MIRCGTESVYICMIYRILIGFLLSLQYFITVLFSKSIKASPLFSLLPKLYFFNLESL